METSSEAGSPRGLGNLINQAIDNPNCHLAHAEGKLAGKLVAMRAGAHGDGAAAGGVVVRETCGTMLETDYGDFYNKFERGPGRPPSHCKKCAAPARRPIKGGEMICPRCRVARFRSSACKKADARNARQSQERAERATKRQRLGP